MSKVSNHTLSTYMEIDGEEYPVRFDYRYYPASLATRTDPASDAEIMLTGWTPIGWQAISAVQADYLNTQANNAWQDSYTQDAAHDGAQDDLDRWEDDRAFYAGIDGHDDTPSLQDNAPLEHFTERA